MHNRGRVPEFGKWDGANTNEVAYTKVFEVARKDKGAPPIMINPNDPQQNPEAFRPAPIASSKPHKIIRPPPPPVIVPASPPVRPSIPRPDMDQPRNGHRKTGSTGSVYAQPTTRQRFEPSRSPGGAGMGNQRGPSVPKFGAWNDSNAAPSEGYTVIFNQVKDKRHTAAVPPPETVAHTKGRVSHHDNDSFWTKITSCFRPTIRE